MSPASRKLSALSGRPQDRPPRHARGLGLRRCGRCPGRRSLALHQVHGVENLGNRHVRSGLMDGLYGELGLRQMVPPLYPGLFEGSADDALHGFVHGGQRRNPHLLVLITKRRALTPNLLGLALRTNPLARPGAREALVAHEAATGFGLVSVQRFGLLIGVFTWTEAVCHLSDC